MDKVRTYDFIMGASRQILEIEALATALGAVIGGGILATEVAAVLERGSARDEYDGVADVDIFDTSGAVTCSTDFRLRRE